jgi:hypothetical protein
LVTVIEKRELQVWRDSDDSLITPPRALTRSDLLGALNSIVVGGDVPPCVALAETVPEGSTIATVTASSITLLTSSIRYSYGFPSENVTSTSTTTLLAISGPVLQS